MQECARIVWQTTVPVAVSPPAFLSNQCRNLWQTGGGLFFNCRRGWNEWNVPMEKSFGCAAVAALPLRLHSLPSLSPPAAAAAAVAGTHALSARRPICPNNDSDSDPIMCGGGGLEGEGSARERESPSFFPHFLLAPCFSRFEDFCVTPRLTRYLAHWKKKNKGRRESLLLLCS